jgi:hypothetical protein
MGLLSGGLNGRRYRITSALPDGFRDTFMEALREHKMVTDLDASDGEPRVGWVHAFDPSLAAFELNDFLFDRFLVVSMRVDKTSVNGRFLKIALAERERALCEERGLEKLAKAEKEMVKEQLEAELTRRAIPSTSTVDLAWDVTTGEVIVFSTSESAIELVDNLFFETFGLPLRPERMCDWLTEKFDRKEVVDRTSQYLPDARGGQGMGEVEDGYHADDPLEGAHKGLAVDFITWLWLQSESSDGHFRVLDGAGAREAALAKLDDDVDDEWNDITETLRHADLTLWLEGKLKLARLGVDDSPETTTIVGEAPTTTDAARHDVQAGKQPVEATMGLKLDELECKMTLVATAGGLAVTGLKLPFEVKQGTDEKIFERMMLLDLVHTTIKQLFQQFWLARTSPAWFQRVGAWMQDELAAK